MFSGLAHAFAGRTGGPLPARFDICAGRRRHVRILSFLERSWQSRHLPQDAIHVSADRIRKGNEYDLYSLFEMPAVYDQIRNRYALKSGDPGAPGLFLYFYLPSWLYDIRSLGPDTVYKRIAEKLKADLQDPSEPDLIAQRSLPLALGFRFLSKNAYPHHEMSRWISIVRTLYFRENTWVRGVLQSPRRQFRIHAPEDNEWRTFLPFLEDTRLLAGGETPSHDFRGNGHRRLTLQEAERIGAERVEYPERIPFGSLLTYAKKGEISLEQYPEATDKLYIDRVNVLVNGSEHRREILQQLRQAMNRELTDEDFYPLFNYGQKLRGYLPARQGRVRLREQPRKLRVVLRCGSRLDAAETRTGTRAEDAGCLLGPRRRRCRGRALR